MFGFVKDKSSGSPPPAPTGVWRNATVVNRFGIHARPAALIVKTAAGFQSDIFLEKSGSKVSAKSIMGLLTLEGYPGTVFRVTAQGPDADAAADAIADLFEKKFFED